MIQWKERVVCMACLGARACMLCLLPRTLPCVLPHSQPLPPAGQILSGCTCAESDIPTNGVQQNLHGDGEKNLPEHLQNDSSPQHMQKDSLAEQRWKFLRAPCIHTCTRIRSLSHTLTHGHTHARALTHGTQGAVSPM